MPAGDSKSSSENIAELRLRAEKEPVATFLNMRLIELSPGYAKVAMKLKPEYLNFNGMVLGGIVMTLADQAFAYGSNSLSLPSIATQFNIHLIAAASATDELIAECRVLKSGRRVGISEVTITNQDGKLIAKATGTTIPVQNNHSIQTKKPNLNRSRTKSIDTIIQ